MKGPNTDLLPYQVVMAVAAAAIGGIVAVLGELRDELGFSSTGIGVIVSAGFFAAFLAQMGFAQYADRGFAREMVTIGVAVSAVALLAMAVVDSLPLWILARAMVGFGTGLIFPGLRRAACVLNPNKVGENLGRLVLGEVLGFLFGPMIAAVFARIGGIRLPFIVLAVLMVVFIPVAMRLPNDQGALDTSGRRTSLDLLSNRRLQGALLLIAAYFVQIGAFESVLPVMFRDRGGSTIETGMAFTGFAIPLVLLSTLAGRTADRLGPAQVALAGTTFLGFAAFVYGFLPGIWIPILVFMAVGCVDGFGFIATQVAVSRSVEQERQAGALGLRGKAF